MEGLDLKTSSIIKAIDSASKIISNSISLKYTIIASFWSGGRIVGNISEDITINKNPTKEHIAVIRIVVRLFFIFSNISATFLLNHNLP